MARYEDAFQVTSTFDWSGGDSKYFISSLVEIKLIWLIWRVNIDLRHIFEQGGEGRLCGHFCFSLNFLTHVYVPGFGSPPSIISSLFSCHKAPIFQTGILHVGAV